MQTVSSNWTLFLKLCLPTIYITFLGAFTMAMFFTEVQFVGPLPAHIFRLILLGILLVGVLFLYWSVMRIKRVAMDEHFVYATNYFKNYRYPYHNIEKVVEKDWLFFRTIHVSLKEPGSFGKKISFIASKKRLNAFLVDHPEVVKALDL